MAVQDKDKLVSLEDLKTAYDDLDGDISNVKNTLDHKADAIYDTVSGDIASFPDGADGLPVKDLTVAIEPVQDLHGYDYPWPAGGSNNLIPDGTNTSNGYKADYYLLYNGGEATTSSSVGVSYISEYFPVSPNTSYVYSCKIAKNNQSVCFYDANKEYLSGARFSGATSIVVTTPANAVYARATQSFADNALYQFELGSTGTSITPYSNICPISGWTGANVTRMGKNIFDEANADWVEGYVISATGEITSNVGWKYTRAFLPVGANTGYTIQFNKVTSPSVAAANHIVYYDTNQAFIERHELVAGNITGNLSATFTTPSNCAYYRLTMAKTGITKVQIEVGSTATTYEPFVGTTIPITFNDSQGDPLTVYGGTLDVTTGVLTVDRASVDLGTLSWNLTSGTVTRFSATPNPAIKVSSNRSLYIQCSCYAPNIGGGAYAPFTIYNVGNDIYVVDGTYESASDFTTAVTGQIAVYPLAQPLVIQLDPVTVNTLLGQNNVWSDTGAVLNCEYPADTKLYIQKINTPTDDDMIADANIASGKYFIVNNNLYLSTAAILAGDPIKPGTNCTLTNLAAALNALNS